MSSAPGLRDLYYAFTGSPSIPPKRGDSVKPRAYRQLLQQGPSACVLVQHAAWRCSQYARNARTSAPVSVKRMNAGRAFMVWTVLGFAAIAVFVASLALGSIAVSPLRVMQALTSHSTDVIDEIVLSLRLPRALGGFASGALLGMAGALLQVLLRNPLAEPYVLGVSGGAAAFALAAMLFSLSWWSVELAAFVGAFLSILLVLGLARRELWRGEPQDTSPRLLLTGAVIAAGWGALITLMLAVAPENRLRGMVFWLTGDLNGVAMPWTALVALAIALVAIVPAAPQLNVLLRGDVAAEALGVHVVKLRLRVYLVASLAAAAAVTTAGTIGFIGLVVPHVLRLAFGNDQRMLLPASALAGGLAVMGADLIARTVIAPAQLPVGVITALIGVPVFLWMLLRRAP
jgi:iron complex transport system permease protein